MNKTKTKKIFYSYVNEINKLIGHSNTTFGDELNGIGKFLFGKKFKGVWPSDKIPKLGKNQYVILNLDKSNEEGSHWIAMIKDSKENTYIYDSFGRPSKKIIPNVYKSGNKKIKDSHPDPEQKVKQNNCGQLSMSAILMYDYYGANIFKYI